MTTLGQLKALARSELGDAGPTPLWPEERLSAWVRAAVQAYGQVWPRHLTVDLSTVAGQVAYGLPADALHVLAVEYPPGFRLAASSAGWPADGRPAFDVFDSQLLLDPVPSRTGDQVRVRYAARYAEPALDGDILATPPADDDLLVLDVAARALRWLWATEAKSQRYGGQLAAVETARDRAGLYERALEIAINRRRRLMRFARLSALGP